jgi:hypothetical protein
VDAENAEHPRPAGTSRRLAARDQARATGWQSRFSSTVKGKDGGFDMKTGLGVAKFARSMYRNMMTGTMMMNAFNLPDGRESARNGHAGQSRAHE